MAEIYPETNGLTVEEYEAGLANLRRERDEAREHAAAAEAEKARLQQILIEINRLLP